MTPAFAPIIPRATRLWLEALRFARAQGAYRAGATYEAAALEGTAASENVRAALKDGTLLEMDPNVITREIEAGIAPHEFRDGPVFWGGSAEPVPVSAPIGRDENTNRETDPPLKQPSALDLAKQIQMTLGGTP